MCPDYSCADSPQDCAQQQACSDASPDEDDTLRMVRCPDGSCAVGILYCPNPTTCPPGYFMCEDGSCHDEATAGLDSCVPALGCPEGFVGCPDGCRAHATVDG